jgi:regulator of replication initiation timing
MCLAMGLEFLHDDPALIEVDTSSHVEMVEAELMDLDHEMALERPHFRRALVKRLAARRREMAKRRKVLRRQKRLGMGKDASNKFYEDAMKLMRKHIASMSETQRKAFVPKEARLINKHTNDIRNEELGYAAAMVKLENRYGM